jgi:hypothetical protein
VAGPATFLGLTRLFDRARFSAALALALGGVAAPLLLTDPTMFVASIRFIATRQSWETIWAMLEGYGGVGRVPLLASRFDPSQVNFELHPSTLPWPVIYGGFILLCLALYTRRLDWSRPAVALPAVGLTLNLFLLFSKGYSPQFLLYPLALLVIILPGGWAAAYAVILTAIGSIEYPWAFGLFADDKRLLWLVVVTRTLLWLWISAEYFGMLFGRPKGIWARLREPAGRLVLGAGAAAIALGGGLVVAHYVRPTRPGDADAVASYVRAFAGPGEAAIASSRDGFYAIRPLVGVDRWLLAEGDEGQWPAPIDQRVADARDGRDRVWLILDQSGAQGTVTDTLARLLETWGSPATDVWFGRFHLLGYLPFEPPVTSSSVPLRAMFGHSFDLHAYDLSTRSVTPGEGLTLTLDLSTEGRSTKDTKAFVHLENAQGQIISQRDRLLTPGRPADGKLATLTPVREGFDLLIPATTPAGRYTLVAGLYDPTTGQRLPITAGTGAGGDKIVLGQVTVQGG